MRAALVFWILSAAVCVVRGHPHEGHEGQGTALDSSANIMSLVTSGNRGFAFRLYRKLAAHNDTQVKNIFFSPLSVSVALAALSVGARGETHEQLFSGLGFNSSQLTQAEVDQAFNTLLDTANSASTEDLSKGTAVFVDNHFKPQPDFLEVLKQSYLADGFNVDFLKATESANAINKYVADKTNGKIEKLVDSLDPRTVMYLISYIYFKGKWATPFQPEKTRKDTFRVDENTEVPVDMMNLETEFDVYYDIGINTTVLRLPFNSSYSMLLVLPNDITELETVISPNYVTKWLRWMKSRTYDVFIPKFSIKTSYSLRDVLAEMGMTDMFDARADLSGIANNLAVSEVVHQATLDVDEVGATAAAATGVGIMLMSFRHIPVLKFNRPFMVLITEHTTANILFMGKIVNPNI